MERLIDTLEIGDGDLFTENYLVEARDKEGIKEAAMIDGHPDDASDEFEV